MKSQIYKLFFLTFILTSLVAAQKSIGPKFSAEIIFGPKPTHLVQITNDTLVIASGSTYSFTVDTPENEGLISTKIGAAQLLLQIAAKDGSSQKYEFKNKDGSVKTAGEIETGDQLLVTSQDGKLTKIYRIIVRPMALSGELRLESSEITVNHSKDLTLYFTAGQRSPETTVRVYLPNGVKATMDNTTVNVIGRGEVKLKDLSTQSVGRAGAKYPYSKVGQVKIAKSADGGQILTFTRLDLRPANGADLKIVIPNVTLRRTGKYLLKADYTTSKPEILTSAGTETAVLTATRTISDFERVLDKRLQYRESPATFTTVNFRWSSGQKNSAMELMQSTDKGKSWEPAAAELDAENSTAKVSGLIPNKLYTFRLSVKNGENKGFSNPVSFYSGKLDIKNFKVKADGNEDDTDRINEAIEYLSRLGGGTLLFSDGIYQVRTVHLKSNVYLYLEKGATIRALKGADAPEPTWFSDQKYRSGLSSTDTGPYQNPENWLTKQDVGHHYFRNSMFFGERLDNVKIIGNGYLTGNGNLVTGDRVMNNPPDNRADKMFTCKLCTNLEIGGPGREQDLWYDAQRDEPYYLEKDGSPDFGHDNMLKIDRAGHFALLATGTDGINVHDTYFAANNTSNARDIYDFMACRRVTVTNIYSKVSSDDIIKLGSDSSLGFTRPAGDYKIRNVIGDTNCNLFQIGSETADDITDVHVDNIYVLGANKAGFSISTNDGATVKDIHLNCGHTGSLHSRSKMYRTFTPFFISISNRGRLLGADVARCQFEENGVKRDELLVTNVNIGRIENIILNGIDIEEVYGGSSYNGERWKSFDGSQRRATTILAGYQLPASERVAGGLNFKLPNGLHTGYLKNIVFNDIHTLVKGGNPLSDAETVPPELGVGQYNASNLKIQPAYGLWARHVLELTIKNTTFNYEKRDSRYALFLDDVIGAKISGLKTVRSMDSDSVIKLKNSSHISIENSLYYHDRWGESPTFLPSR
jgi:polygalacturonase